MLGALLVTLVLSCTVSEIGYSDVLAAKLRIFHTPLLFAAPVPMYPLEFHGKVKRLQKYTVSGKRGHSFFLHRRRFVIFGMIHPEDSLF